MFLRLEFQDGSLKLATQEYHGSGTVHGHALGFGSTAQMKCINWADVLSGTIPSDQIFSGYVLGSQVDRDGNSGWPQRDAPTQWNTESESIELHHPTSANELGTRAYFPDVMESCPSHQDFLATASNGLLRKYMSENCSMFSDSPVEDCFNDEADAVSIAVNVQMRYKPFEPEMILQMFGNRFRQWWLSTESHGKRDLVVPLPDTVYTKGGLQLYRSFLGMWKDLFVGLLT